MKIHKDYIFTEPEIVFEHGVVRGKLRGTMKNVDDNTSVNQAPYELLVWFQLDGELVQADCPISLSGIRLNNTEIKREEALPTSMNTVVRKNYKSEQVASFNIKNLSLDYHNHQLSFSYSINCVDDVLQGVINMDFDTHYNERKITFWNTLMGV